MKDRAKAVVEAFEQFTEYEPAEAYVEIGKVWRAPCSGPAPFPQPSRRRTGGASDGGGTEIGRRSRE
jgi:hypothetical protein